jgi:flagellar hook-associated protein 2
MESTMPSIAGLASGIDTNAIVKQLLEAATGPIKSMQKKISDHEYRKSQLQVLNNLLSIYQGQLESTDTASEFPEFTSSSADPDSLSVAVSGAATPGVYSVAVDQKAQSSQVQSGSFASTTETLKAGTVTVTVGSTVTEVTIDAATGTKSLQDLADYLTNSVAGVNAYVLDTGSATDPYKMIVTGSNTGAVNAVSLSVSQTGAVGSDLAFSTSRSAQDAQVTIDGNVVTRASNTFDDAVPGLSLSLLGVQTTAFDVTVTRDTAAMTTKVTDLVTAHNKLVTFFKKHSGPTADPVLAGDQTLRSIQRHLQSVVSAGYSTSNVAGLNSIGIGSNQQGELEFDSSDFSSKLGTNWEDVLSMLTGTAGLFGAMQAQIDADIDPEDGLIQPRIDSIDARVLDITDKIEDAERRLIMYEDVLKSQFLAMETTLAKYQATQSYLEMQTAQRNKK